MTVEEVAYEVCTAMDRAGVIAVLSGGGAATFYAPEAYQTRDLDFILPFVVSGVSAQPIFDLGFAMTSTRGTYARPGTPFTLEFIDGPLAVGDETISRWDTHRSTGRLLHIVSPTDCVRDRLAAAIHWNDVASIQQAVAVIGRQPVDLDLVRRCCESEGGSRVHNLLSALLDRPKDSTP